MGTDTDRIVKQEKRMAIVWLHGAIAAFIGGGAGAISGAVVAPEAFNLHAGLVKMIELAAMTGFVNLAMFLKQSPLPQLPKDFLSVSSEVKYSSEGDTVLERKTTVRSTDSANAQEKAGETISNIEEKK